MLVTEFRIAMPFTLDEYEIGQLYCICESSKKETGGGEGVEILKNEPFSNTPLFNGEYDSGQYTYKIYHVDRKAPALVRMLAPHGALEIHEECWNAFPYCRTLLTNPGYMKNNFLIQVDSLHIADRGHQHNVHQLSDEMLRQRKIHYINIAEIHSDEMSSYKPEEDPKLVKGHVKNRGPLSDVKYWRSLSVPIMTCYKLVTIVIRWWGLQGTLEAYAMDTQRRLVTRHHRQIYCTQDEWIEMTLEEIREMEEETEDILQHQMRAGSLRGSLSVAFVDTAFHKQRGKMGKVPVKSSSNSSGFRRGISSRAGDAVGQGSNLKVNPSGVSQLNASEKGTVSKETEEPAENVQDEELDEEKTTQFLWSAGRDQENIEFALEALEETSSAEEVTEGHLSSVDISVEEALERSFSSVSEALEENFGKEEVIEGLENFQAESYESECFPATRTSFENKNE